MIMILPPVTATGEGISVERNTETSVRRSRRANPACVRMAAPGSKYGRAEAMGSGSTQQALRRGAQTSLEERKRFLTGIRCPSVLMLIKSAA